MQIVSTIKKLLDSYTPEKLLGHIANELELRANHFEVVGAPNRARWTRQEVEVLREAKAKIEGMPY